MASTSRGTTAATVDNGATPISPPALAIEPGEASKGSSWLPSDLLASNPYFSAGFGLMVFGTALALGRRGITQLATQTQRRLLISLEIPSKDKAHPWFLQWMGAQAKAQAMRNAGLLPNRKESLREFIGLNAGGSSSSTGKSKAEDSNQDQQQVWETDPLQSGNTRASPIRIFSHELSVETSYSDLKSRTEQQQSSSNSRGDARFSLVPGPGTHWFRYKGCWMRVSEQELLKSYPLN
jgi:chaperone BCS1